MAFFSEELAEEFSKSVVRVDFLAKMEFASKTLYIWNGEYELNIGGNTYIPLHGIASMEGLGQNSNQQSEAITFSLPGIETGEDDFLSLALEETDEVSQRLVTIYMQLFDENWQPKGPAIVVWWGFMQPPRINHSGMSATEGPTQMITMQAENAFFNRSRPAFGRYADRDQQIRSPGDKFFQFTSDLLFKTFGYPSF